MPQKEYRPQDRTLRKTVEYLESIGLQVYGQNCDLTTGQLFPALRDFGAGDVVRFRELFEKGELAE